MSRLFLSALVAACLAPAAAAQPKKPNVLFIAVDDLNHWVGHLGRNPQTKTPSIDRLAKMGVTFTHAYCAAPVCNPSRAALMSGMRPGSTGVYDNGQDWKPVIPKEQTLTTQFLKAGYNVYGSGKIYHANAHRDGEWTDYFVGGKERTTPHPSSKDDGVGGIKSRPLTDDSKLPDESIVNYGIEKLQAKHDKPFFLAVGLHKPHMPWNVPKKYYDLFPLDKIELPPVQKDDLGDVPPAGIAFAKPKGDHAQMLTSGRWKEAVQGYLAAIAYCDAQIGRLLDAYDKSPHKENTIIVFWGDHGWHHGEKEHWRKFALWEESTRMPFVWVAPGVTKAGGVCDRPVDLMSVYPTLCALCGVERPKHVEGEEITPLLRDPAAKWDKPAITTFRLNNHAVRTAEVALHPLRQRRRGTVRPRRGQVRVDQPGEGREVRGREEGTDEAAPDDEQARTPADQRQGLTATRRTLLSLVVRVVADRRLGVGQGARGAGELGHAFGAFVFVRAPRSGCR